MMEAVPQSEVASGGDFIDVTVPDNARMSRISLTMAWWALSTAAFFIVVAPLLSAGFGIGNVIAAMIASVIVFSCWAGR